MKFFDECTELLTKGYKIKLPEWGGFWDYDFMSCDIRIHCKDLTTFLMSDSPDPFYTASFLFRDDWEIATRENTPILGGTATFSFSKALNYLERGHRLTRKGWNGKGMFIVKQNGYPDGIPINENTAQATGLPVGTVCKFKPYLMMKTVNNEFVPWLASQADLLEHDWMFYND